MKKSNKSMPRKLYTIKGSKENIHGPANALDEVKLTRWQIRVQAEQTRREECDQRRLIKEEKAGQAKQLRREQEKKSVAEKFKVVAEKLTAFQGRGTLNNFDEVAFDQSVYDGLSAAGKAHYLKCCQIASGEIAPPHRKKTVGDISDRVAAKSIYNVECSRCGYENTFPKNPVSDQVLKCSNCGLTHTGG